MPRIAYVNGRYMPFRQAAVHVEDRGLQFADSVYEVCEIRQKRFVDERRHLDRLERSLGELRIKPPMGREPLRIVMRQVVAAERVETGLLYIQITRGVAPRDHAFPAPEVRPGVIVVAKSVDPTAQERKRTRGVSVITVPESRWDRVDIKTTSLTANVMAKQAAIEKGAAEAWFVDRDGFVTEGSSSNAWIVNQDDVIVTRAPDHSILRGITREVTKETALSNDFQIEERGFTLSEATSAREAFLTSASSDITPILSIDGRMVGNGKVGPVANCLRQCFYDMAEFESAI